MLIFTAIISISIGYSKLRAQILQVRRESVAISIVQLFPNSEIVKVSYEAGNGLEVPPNVKVYVSNEAALDEISGFYNDFFNKNGWKRWHEAGVVGGKWEKDNVFVYMTTNRNEKKTEDYLIALDFYGLWLSQLSQNQTILTSVP